MKYVSLAVACVALALPLRAEPPGKPAPGQAWTVCVVEKGKPVDSYVADTEPRYVAFHFADRDQPINAVVFHDMRWGIDRAIEQCNVKQRTVLVRPVKARR